MLFLSHNRDTKQALERAADRRTRSGMYFDNICSAARLDNLPMLVDRLVPVMIATWKRAAKTEIHTAKPKANIYVIFPFSLFNRAAIISKLCNAAVDGHKPVKMQSDKYYLKRGKQNEIQDYCKGN